MQIDSFHSFPFFLSPGSPIAFLQACHRKSRFSYTSPHFLVSIAFWLSMTHPCPATLCPGGLSFLIGKIFLKVFSALAMKYKRLKSAALNNTSFFTVVKMTIHLPKLGYCISPWTYPFQARESRVPAVVTRSWKPLEHSLAGT